ncbi:MAG: hypothetical protein COV98_05350 [Candidatus Altarchaeum sp. CG12_big_fil_rev_8_21_14_0_65_33_22]|nr:MAG: hypothetical protein COV98_05350 [Candidatus Altarchaeum sp. CG12_big_fil_rev_8_21_14_0_65_33_22]PIV27788.1 MAG: hypothetical protein COS36_04435 [Candidatus Altarchaeum sp. CG03_land_8_20_14_0_80_32_618]PIX49075.1 MAG: hypothetical protein COZ53_01900 [Candidatus Altarchaeum sp. CG_4_8_14_3_um_filter_33_2054]PIZ30140.1 MAG: hypothetical protein COY41_04460 [Candidatus Altarchaeum sp. CG_4_10_14_0_8_um_filter_32_851]PJC13669.1 MAG: hypothetical protein CO063_03805 [Candidatus Altarchaeu
MSVKIKNLPIIFLGWLSSYRKFTSENFKRHERSEWNKVSVKIKNLPIIFKMKFCKYPNDSERIF